MFSSCFFFFFFFFFFFYHLKLDTFPGLVLQLILFFRHKNVACHVSPAFRIEEGDVVTVGECRPLSKTIKFNVLRVDRSRASKHFEKF